MPTLARTVLTAAALSVSLTTWAAAGAGAGPAAPNLPEGYRADSVAIERTLAKSLALYRSARTMRFSVLEAAETTRPSSIRWSSGPYQGRREERSIFFASPERWAVVNERSSRYRDGERFIVAQPNYFQYIESATIHDAWLPFAGLPERLFLLPDESGPGAFGNGFEPVGIREGPHEGRDAVWIFGAAAVPPGVQGAATLTIAFDRETGLLLMAERTTRRIISWPEGFQPDRRDRFQAEVTRMWSHITTTLDEPVTDEQLAFRAEHNGVPLVRVSSYIHPQLLRFDLESEERRARPPVDFEATTLDGRVVKLSDFRGRVVVLDFWASWCGPCIRGMPDVRAAYEGAADLPVTFLGVNVDSTEQGLAKARELVERHKLTFPHVLDPERKIAAQFGVPGYPTHTVIDKEGRVYYPRIGIGPGSVPMLKEVVEAPPRDPGASSRLEELRALAAAFKAAGIDPNNVYWDRPGMGQMAR